LFFFVFLFFFVPNILIIDNVVCENKESML
jgi:hypothetical protein